MTVNKKIVAIDPADRIETLPEGLPELTLGWGLITWVHTYLKHPNGIRAGKPWLFTKDQTRFILWFYAVNPDGSWVFTRGSRRLAKGSGKSPFAAVVAIIELLAPCRVDYFDPSVPGGVVGKPVAMPLVQLAAVSEKQTENTMRMVRAMTNKHSAKKLHEDYDLDTGKTQIFVQPEGKLEVITSSAETAEGAEATFIVGDELEHWTPANGGIELHNTLVDNLTKSGSRMLETLNAWKPDIGSAGEATFSDWCDQERKSTKSKMRILYDARKAPANTDLNDPESLRAALEHVYKDCSWSNIDATIARIQTKSSKIDDSKRKYLNWPSAADDSWIEPESWAAIARPEIVVEEGEKIVMFFDGSSSRDYTALIGCRVSDGHIFTLGIWEPDDLGDGETLINFDAVDARVQQVKQYYNVVAFFADVREWESFTKITWAELFRDSLELWAEPGNKNQPVAWDMRGKSYQFTMATEMAEAEIMNAMFTHDGDSKLGEHVRNARRRENRWGITIGKESRTSRKKIDGAVCMIGARMVYRLYKEQVSNEKEDKAEKKNGAFFLM